MHVRELLGARVKKSESGPSLRVNILTSWSLCSSKVSRLERIVPEKRTGSGKFSIPLVKYDLDRSLTLWDDN